MNIPHFDPEVYDRSVVKTMIGYEIQADSQHYIKHTQNAKIQIILRMRKAHPGLCSPLIHYVVSNGSVSG